MSNHSVNFEASRSGLVLANAILLYKNTGAPRGEAAAFASIHDIEHDDDRPTIAAGEPLSRAHLRQWAEALGRSAAPEILPENVLVSHVDMIAWWVPEQVRAAYFDLTRPAAGLKALMRRTTVRVPYPAHLFIATRSGVRVYALPTNDRPTASTAVLHSPILNVYLNGSLCWGNIPKPKALTTASMAEYEAAVFDSWSTHPNGGQELTVSGKGGLVRLWDDLASRGAKRFPVKRLKPFDPSMKRNVGAEPITLGTLIARSTRV